MSELKSDYIPLNFTDNFKKAPVYAGAFLLTILFFVTFFATCFINRFLYL